MVGAGYIGLEIGTAYAELGTEVTIVEATDEILPQYNAARRRPFYPIDSFGRVEAFLLHHR